MKKWNNVYFYSYDSSGKLIKNKLINITETDDKSKSNLIIYPAYDTTAAAATAVSDDGKMMQTGITEHYHYNQWEIEVYTNNFL